VTLIIASAIIGWGAAVLWTSPGSLVTHSSPPGKLGAYNACKKETNVTTHPWRL